MPAASAIRIDKVSKRYTIYASPLDRLKRLFKEQDESGAHWALHDVDIDIRHGEVVGIIGRNGAGKSTLLQLVCGTVAPSSGSVTVDGRIAALLELGAGFNPDFTGRENVYLNAAILGLSPREIDERFEAIAAFADIGEFIDRQVKTYSSGMYVRLAFAVAIHVEPQILIIDEALSVGDGMFSRKSFERIMQLKESGKTILFCSHSMYQIEALCSRVIWLEKGRLMMVGEPAEVVAAYNDFQRKLEAPATQTATTALAAPVSQHSHSGRLTEVCALSTDGQAVHELLVASGVTDLALRIRFQCNTDLPEPVIGIAIMTDDGRAVCSASTLNDRVATTRQANGDGEVLLRFPRLPLLKGHYFVDVWLLDETGLHCYDAAQAAVGLRVSQQGLEQGLVSLPHHWEIPQS